MICRDLVNRIYTQPRMNGLNGYLELARMLNVVTNVTYYVLTALKRTCEFQVLRRKHAKLNLQVSAIPRFSLCALIMSRYANPRCALIRDCFAVPVTAYGLPTGRARHVLIRYVSYFSLCFCEKIVGRISDPPTIADLRRASSSYILLHLYTASSERRHTSRSMQSPRQVLIFLWRWGVVLLLCSTEQGC